MGRAITATHFSVSSVLRMLLSTAFVGLFVWALLAQDLLPQDVCMPAVLSELTQDVKVHPAQRERAAAVAVNHVVQPQG